MLFLLLKQVAKRLQTSRTNGLKPAHDVFYVNRDQFTISAKRTASFTLSTFL